MQFFAQIDKEKTCYVDSYLEQLSCQINSLKSHLQTETPSITYPKNPLETYVTEPNLEQKLNLLYTNLKNEFQGLLLNMEQKVKKINPNKDYQQAVNM